MGKNIELELKVKLKFMKEKEIKNGDKKSEEKCKTIEVTPEELCIDNGIKTVVYDGKLNIVIINGMINANNINVLNKINEVAEKTTQNVDILSYENKKNNYDISEINFWLEIKEENHKDIHLIMDQSRIIMYNEIYHKGKDLTTGKVETGTSFNIVIRGFNITKMPEKEFGIRRIKDYAVVAYGVTTGILGIITGGTGEICTVGFATPVAGVITIVGIAQLTQSVSSFCSMYKEDFMMAPGLGYGDEGDFMKSGFETVFGEDGGEVYEDVFFCLSIYSLGRTTTNFLRENIKYKMVNTDIGKVKKIDGIGSVKNYAKGIKENTIDQNIAGALENISYGNDVYSSLSSINGYINSKKER